MTFRKSCFFICLLVVQALSGATDNCGGSAQGDPHFVGFHREKFNFFGRAGGVFNIFSDPFINVNSEFGSYGGTIMVAFGIMFNGHQLSFAVNGSSSSAWEIKFDGVDRKLDSSLALVNISECTRLIWTPRHLKLVTAIHEFEFIHRSSRDGRYSWLDFSMIHGGENDNEMNGVLGQTAFENATISLVAEDFVAAGLFELAKSNRYVGRSIKCVDVPAVKSKKDASHKRYITECEFYLLWMEYCYNPSDCTDIHGSCVQDVNRNSVCYTEDGAFRSSTCSKNSDCPKYFYCAKDRKQCFAPN